MHKRLLIIWCSRTGGSAQMALAVARGARGEAGVQVTPRRARRTRAEEVLAADALVFVTPENLAGLAGEMKDFFDRTYYALLDRMNGKPYAALICAGSDGSNAARQLERIATGLRLRRVAETYVVCTHAQTPEAILARKRIPAGELERCAQTGAALAAGLGSGIF